MHYMMGAIWYVSRSNRYGQTYLHASSTESVSPLSIPDQSEVNCVCPICMDNRADSLLLPCGHRTCSDCLLDWRRKSICKSLPGLIWERSCWLRYCLSILPEDHQECNESVV